ncbi:MAG: alanine--glyoxylate aminotransferase family protein [Planctomycetota bacterium]|jgi:predicted phosphoserine aminotransferase|nr:alanine--glyoxylate aminotransferase family protein [Planctomycetota bacterium]
MKLYIPGPTQVSPEILAQMANPAIGHRTPECAQLWQESRAGLRKLMHTKNEVVILTAPASAMMEAAIRNTVKSKSLHLICGAFSKRWFEIAKSVGVDAIGVEKKMGQGFSAEDLRSALNECGPVDAVTVVHNETSTGVTNPVQDYAEVLKDFPDTLLLVDTVSSMSGTPVLVDKWEIDVCLFGVQKCMALPAGIAVASLSTKVLERAATIEHRGWFLDFLRLAKSNLKEQSPTTPSTSHLYALTAQLKRIFAEGIEARWQRHYEMATFVRNWARSHGYTMFPDDGFCSDTVSCISRGDGPDFVPVLEELKQRGILISNGYGDLKGKTFRIGHMGEHCLDDIRQLTEIFDSILEPVTA